jgi:LAGLIDADG endonuclease
MELTPEWVVGFVDGEGCFFVGIQRNATTSTGYQVIPEFRIVQHLRDVQVLHGLKRFFGCGSVCQNHEDRWELRIRKLENLRQIAAFFEKHPLKTKKQIDFLKFRDVLRLMHRQEHLAVEGIRRIASIASGMNTCKREAIRHLLDKDIVHAGSKESETT